MAFTAVLAALVGCVSGSGGAGVSGSAGAGASASKSALQNRYLAFLREEGYTPSIDSDGDILFKIQGKSYYIIVNEDDAEHFMILYPNFWSADTAQKRRQATLAASYATRMTKVARVYLGSNNHTTATSEVFLSAPEDYRYIFHRMLRSIATAIENFEEYINT
jgi:hypothetical protein